MKFSNSILEKLETKANWKVLWLLAGLLLLLIGLNAWVSDDAYITFRTVANFVNGYGPNYNVGERVQTFTNPLWMLLMTPLYAMTGEAYFTSLLLSFALSTLNIWLISRHIFIGKYTGLIALALLMGSSSAIQYSTSGLENVLNGTILIGFIVIFLSDKKTSKTIFWLSFLAALGIVSRMDTALFYLPALVFTFWRNRSLQTLFRMTLGMTPLLLWLGFATIYYGFPFPNTAYAKLNAGLSKLEMLQHGIWYYQNLLFNDPASFLLIFTGLIAGIFNTEKGLRPIWMGMLLYLIYIIWIGGDFMAGRFFYLPVLVAAILLAEAMPKQKMWLFAGGTVLALGILNTSSPYYAWAKARPANTALLDAHEIADERAWYQEKSALINYNDSIWVKVIEAEYSKHKNDTVSQTYMFWDFIGFMGYAFGPGKHVVDKYALADPLLSRLPMAQAEDWRIGHFTRVFPIGYRKTLRKGENFIEDPALAEYFNRLSLITRGPIWSWKRMETIWKFNLGHYDHLIDKDYYREPSPLAINYADLLDADFESKIVPIFSQRPLTINMRGLNAPNLLEIALLRPNTYRIEFLLSGEVLQEAKVVTGDGLGELGRDTLFAPAADYDAIRVEGLGGNEHFGIGGLRVLRW